MHRQRSLGLTSTASHHQIEDEQHKARTSYSAPARARTCRAWKARGFANPTTGPPSASPPYRNGWNLVDNHFGCWRPGILQHLEKTRRKKPANGSVKTDRSNHQTAKLGTLPATQNLTVAIAPARRSGLAAVDQGPKRAHLVPQKTWRKHRTIFKKWKWALGLTAVSRLAPVRLRRGGCAGGGEHQIPLKQARKGQRIL